MLSKTAQKIMKVLIHQDDDFITYERIAGMLEISERSVHNYMKEAAEFCEENGYQLVRRRGRGVCLQAGCTEKNWNTYFRKTISPAKQENTGCAILSGL